MFLCVTFLRPQIRRPVAHLVPHPVAAWYLRPQHFASSLLIALFCIFQDTTRIARVCVVKRYVSISAVYRLCIEKNELDG